MSGETSGTTIDLAAITETAAADGSGVAHAKELLAFTESAVRRDVQKLGISRDSLRAALGNEGLVDAAAIVANFERMTRIADATGIPLDGPVNAMSAEFQENLGLRKFRSSANTVTPNALLASIAARARPYVFRLLGAITRRTRPKHGV